LKKNLEKKINILHKYGDSKQMKPNEKRNIFGTLKARKRELEKITDYCTKGSIVRGIKLIAS